MTFDHQTLPSSITFTFVPLWPGSAMLNCLLGKQVVGRLIPGTARRKSWEWLCLLPGMAGVTHQTHHRAPSKEAAARELMTHVLDWLDRAGIQPDLALTNMHLTEKPEEGEAE